VFTGTLLVDLLLGDVHTLKEKRSLIRPLVSDMRRQYQVSVAEVGDQELYRRAQVAVAVVADEAAQVADVLDSCERLVAGRPEFELLSARRWLRGLEDE